MSGFQTDVLTGVATLLDATTSLTWNPTGVYAAGDSAIFLKVIAQEPDTAVSLITYPVMDDPSLATSVLGVQVITRAATADPRPVDDLADAVFDQLHGLHDTTLSTGVRLVQCLHQGGGSLGQDDSLRWARSDNYYLTLWRPSPNRA